MNKEQLRNEIERTRSEMLLSAEKQGLTADQTVQLSEKLDEHILLYQKKFSPK
ncbi:hypothetical protein GGQ92_001584 [Gracilibacillus halotolerans]|uniref:Spo0E like sporulation regulatory protein n=1 Tax=Gracilibacillus halotolerans TaxID=74386 RepID=A0A841RNP1_9BACI|nr:aspartyl-phosphate phosphatase Spo0E family protein [Gracilibacillus halotolerans]MBB6512795.1 hypothetical protein [Gracilibacillus halotolerans]